MRASLRGRIFCLLFAGGTFCLHGQTNAGAVAPPANPQLAREYRMISFLTPAQQEQYAKARAKALADNPEVKAEGENLIKQGDALASGGNAAAKQAFIERMLSHRQRLRQAMLKEDSGLEPIFAEIDQHISEMKARQSGASSSSAPPAAFANPSAAH